MGKLICRGKRMKQMERKAQLGLLGFLVLTPPMEWWELNGGGIAATCQTVLFIGIMAAIWFFHQVCLPLLNTFRALSYPQSEVTYNCSALSLLSVCLCTCTHSYTRTNTHTHLRVHALTSKWPLPLTFMCRYMFTFPRLASSSDVYVDFSHTEPHMYLASAATGSRQMSYLFVKM